MVKHYNPSIVQNAQRILNTKGDNLSDEVSGLIATIPIIDVVKIVRSFNKTTTGNSTILTPDRDFYLTGIQLNVSKDAASDSTSVAISGTIDGASRDLCRIPMQTLSVYTTQYSRDFSIPIKIDTNTAISVSCSFTVGTQTAVGIIYGYYEEN
jgi:hypothetical protein